jgi:glycosyltransferase involved in cell wall biosynthesis
MMNENLWKKSGIQVVVSSYNSEEFLPRCFESINNSCKEYDWSFIFANDGSEDKTLNVLKKYIGKLSCVNSITKTFPKAKNVAQAKNRALRLTKILAKNYPVICVVDSDDEMLPDRIDYLLPEMIKQNSKFIIGDYNICNQNSATVLAKADEINMQRDLRFGIWATLFHESLIPKNGDFFNEEMEVYSDFLKWWELKYKDNIDFTFHSGKPVHNFYRRKLSISGETSWQERLKIKEEKERIHKLV